MMTKDEIWSIAQQQLAMDLGCAPQLLNSQFNQVFFWQDHPGRRKYNGNTPALELAIWKGRAFVGCSERIYPWASKYFLPQRAEWLFTARALREIETGLSHHGYEIGTIQHFYLPKVPCQPVQPIGKVRWYDQAELRVFQNDPRWNHTISFDGYSPDVLAVAALDDMDHVKGIAACSMDGEKLWQVDIHVQPEYQGHGIATNLTCLLKDELLRRGIVPFYGTAESHIYSQNVALDAGFHPAWAYLYARPKKGTLR